MAHIKFDYSKVLDKFVAPHEVDNLQAQVTVADEMIRKGTGPGADFLGWRDLPENYDREEFDRILKAAEELNYHPNYMGQSLATGRTMTIGMVCFDLYNNFFPAPLKAVIDRFQRYYSARFKRGAKPPIAKPKRVGVVIVSGSNARQCADYMTATLRQSFTVLNGEVTARYYIPGTDRGQYTFNNIELQKFIHQLRGEGAGR